MQSIVDSAPNKEEVHQVHDLNEPVSIEVWTRLIGACAIVDIGQVIKIDGLAVGATREQAEAAILIGFGIVVQSSTATATLQTAAIVSLTGRNGCQQVFV